MSTTVEAPAEVQYWRVEGVGRSACFVLPAPVGLAEAEDAIEQLRHMTWTARHEMEVAGPVSELPCPDWCTQMPHDVFGREHDWRSADGETLMRWHRGVLNSYVVQQLEVDRPGEHAFRRIERCRRATEAERAQAEAAAR